MRTPLIAGNWKMNGDLAFARELVANLRSQVDAVAAGPDVLICPPAHLLFPMAKALDGSRIQLGAQDAHEAEKGAFTGELSVSMIAETGATCIIIGHSERRQYFLESGDQLSAKVQAVLDGGCRCIYCVGETLAQRDEGRTEEVVLGQLRDAIHRDLNAEKLVIAYEPVWAIGTGRTASPAQAQEVHQAIRQELALIFGNVAAAGIRVLYGGSVKPDNAAELLSQPDIDGALVGGASLVARDFLAIIDAAGSPVRSESR